MKIWRGSPINLLSVKAKCVYYGEFFKTKHLTFPNPLQRGTLCKLSKKLNNFYLG
jgi:hypothetical protein